MNIIELTCGAVLLGLLASCAQPINRHNATRYWNLAQQAENEGNFQDAREGYRRALINAQMGNAPSEGVSAAMYNYGRMSAYMCDFTSAEEALRAALKIDRDEANAPSVILTARLSELARLSAYMDKQSESASYYQEALPLLEQARIEFQDPIGFADYLDAYAMTLRSSESRASGELAARAAKIRERNPERTALFVPENYEARCGKFTR